MSKTPSGRATAPGVDPATPGPTPDANAAPAAPAATSAPNESFTSAKASEATKPSAPPPPAGNGASAELEMIRVRTKDAVILMDPFSAKHIDNRKDGVEVPVTSFINDELAEGGRLEKA